MYVVAKDKLKLKIKERVLKKRVNLSNRPIKRIF